MFSAVSALLFYPIPVDRGEELVFVANKTSSGYESHSYPSYVDLRDRSTLSALIAYRLAPVHVSAGDARERLWEYLASGNYFDVLGVRPALGRLFNRSDDVTPGGHPVTVLAFDFWQRRFAGDPAVVGGSLKINGLDYTIIGVAPRGFTGTELVIAPDLWVPMMMQPQIEARTSFLDRRATHNLFVMARLAPGASRAKAEAELNLIAADVAREFPREEGYCVSLTTPGLLGDMIRRPTLGFAIVLFGLAALVLFLACANLAGLLLASAVEREREMSMRLALGAGRGRLVRQLLAEAVVLSIAGGALGWLLVIALIDVASVWRPPFSVPLVIAMPVDLRVVAFAIGVTLATALLFGLAPALHGTRGDLASGIKGLVRTDAGRRWTLRDLVLIVQVACAILLLAGCALSIRSLQRALAIDLGFDPTSVVSASFDLGLHGYDVDRGRRFQEQVLDAVSRLPGVDAAALAIPLHDRFQLERDLHRRRARSSGRRGATNAHLHRLAPLLRDDADAED